jgi:hypothetical protein
MPGYRVLAGVGANACFQKPAFQPATAQWAKPTARTAAAIVAQSVIAIARSAANSRAELSSIEPPRRTE